MFQNVLIAVHKATEAEITGKFGGWIYGVVRNQSNLHHRKNKHNARNRSLSGSEMDFEDPRALEGLDPIRARRMASAWNRISPLQREALVRYHAGGASASEIAADLQTTENAIRMRLRVGSNALRRLCRAQL